MSEFDWVHLGYVGLFAVTFLAATLVPLSSEAVVVTMAAAGFDHLAVLVVATCGNVLGALVNFAVGRWGGRFIFSRWIRIDAGRLARAQRVYSRWGAPILFFAWVPVLGDALTLAGGVLRVPLPVFAFWVALGKALRYVLVITGTLALTA